MKSFLYNKSYKSNSSCKLLYSFTLPWMWATSLSKVSWSWQRNLLSPTGCLNPQAFPLKGADLRKSNLSCCWHVAGEAVGKSTAGRAGSQQNTTVPHSWELCATGSLVPSASRSSSQALLQLRHLQTSIPQGWVHVLPSFWSICCITV